MPNTYVRKDGTVIKYERPANRDHGHSSGSAANLTLQLPDPTIKDELANIAQALGFVKDRDLGAGTQGSINRLIDAIGQAARRDGSEIVAERLRPILALVK